MGGSDLVTDVGISAVVKGCPLLSDLDVQGCSNVTDIAVRVIWTHSHNMQELRLALCNTLTDLAFPSNGEDDDQKDDSDDLWGLGERGVLAVVSAKEVVNRDPPQSISEGKKVESTVSLEPILVCKTTYALAKGPSGTLLLNSRLDIRRALPSRYTPTIEELAIPRPLSL
jgi:hypothetical protein